MKGIQAREVNVLGRSIFLLLNLPSWQSANAIPMRKQTRNNKLNTPHRLLSSRSQDTTCKWSLVLYCEWSRKNQANEDNVLRPILLRYALFSLKKPPDPRFALLEPPDLRLHVTEQRVRRKFDMLLVTLRRSERRQPRSGRHRSQ
jgi:hypothetical protein